MIRKLILGTASVLALAIGGAAVDFAADVDDAAHHWIDAANLSKDDVRWAQLVLHNIGLYSGSLDGTLGPQTKRALSRFQGSNGLRRTAILDEPTADALVGNTVGQGSSMPAKRAGAGRMENSSRTSGFANPARGK